MQHLLPTGRLIAWSAIFLLVEVAAFILIVLQQNGYIQNIGPASIDFVSFYAAGKLALAGTPTLAYDQLAHHLAEQQARGAGIPYVFFFYPPVYLLLCAALASLPYMLALLLYQAASFLLLAWALRRILADSLSPGARAWLIPVIAFPASFWNLGQGQNAFLAAGLLAWAGLLLARRPVAAGALVGALIFKPHLALLTPVALAAGRHWRAFVAAAATVIGLCLLSLAVFGADTWRAYLTAVSGAESVYATGRINFAGWVSLFAALRHVGVPPPWAYAAQIALAMVSAALVWTVWRRREDAPSRQAALLGASMLAVPLFLLYDQVYAIVAIAWLIRARPLDGVERLTLLLCYPIALVAPVMALGSRWPLGFIVSLAVAALCFRRALRPANA